MRNERRRLLSRRAALGLAKVVNLSIFCVVLVILICACAAYSRSCPSHDHVMGRKLLEGLQGEESSLQPCVEIVLDDILSSEYRFSKDTRVSALQYINIKRLTNFSPSLVQIANLNRAHTEEWKTTLDWISVRQALATLRDFGHVDAASLSEQWLKQDTWIRPAAIRNLQLLGDWKSTDKIAEILCDISLDVEADVELAAAAEFLRESPMTSEAICPCAFAAIESISNRGTRSIFATSAQEDLETLAAAKCIR